MEYDPTGPWAEFESCLGDDIDLEEEDSDDE